ncbi:5-formyltetrahydrofolate cyclo-ligase, mitochondrial [Daucus carota subsp. sativus]|uniref:5-formyltetrahydrofolate cyclo-ligase n=2 Tax=Daucus carota subsp. sativus TaxID=79200 RepID=A0A164XK41_DAUCS|nr:PREDICTED: 5-formyltetrahydrofolate cyclo-ligase, mitochondrial [Daucus carota subsp. sativus]
MGWLKKASRKLVTAVAMTHPRTLASPPPTTLPIHILNYKTPHLHSSTLSPHLNLRPPPRLTYAPPPSSSAASKTMSTEAALDHDTLLKQKRILRTKVKSDLKSMDPAQRAQEDIAIQKIVLEAPWYKSCKGLCAYISCSSLREVDTSNLLSDVLQTTNQDGHSLMGRKLYVPRVEDKNRHMRMLKISSVDDLIANSMNILEPNPVDADGNEREDVMLANDPVDMFILPGLAFDKSGRRLGRGGGYYDTLLMNYQNLAKERGWKQPLLIALSYSVQILDENVIPVAPYDIPIDALVSPSGLILIRQTAFERCQ